jgi:hypothetical protein
MSAPFATSRDVNRIGNAAILADVSYAANTAPSRLVAITAISPLPPGQSKQTLAEHGAKSPKLRG